jgi:hypothetical protein
MTSIVYPIVPYRPRAGAPADGAGIGVRFAQSARRSMPGCPQRVPPCQATWRQPYNVCRAVLPLLQRSWAVPGTDTETRPSPGRPGRPERRACCLAGCQPAISPSFAPIIRTGLIRSWMDETACWSACDDDEERLLCAHVPVWTRHADPGKPPATPGRVIRPTPLSAWALHCLNDAQDVHGGAEGRDRIAQSETFFGPDL